jgi:hypothetical protein
MTRPGRYLRIIAIKDLKDFFDLQLEEIFRFKS